MNRGRRKRWSQRNKVAYLTFDDGPSKNTNQILSILKRYGIKGTFFVLGKETPYGLSMYRKIIKQGHIMGNHTYSHDYAKIYSNKKSFFQDFDRLEKLLTKVVGFKPRLFRFPGGSNNRLLSSKRGLYLIRSIKAKLKSRKYRYCDWTIDSQDSCLPRLSPSQISTLVLNESRRSSRCIILFHDFADNSTAALPVIIKGLRAQGFRFGVLSLKSYNYQIAEGQR
ncbi:polysaccharide deacetylase family protein [Paenibacillus sp. CCS19]|uniref:polysaccharide deacetylase family protein n=1 Tax=Paenibacillus sp. CCS19 TaxID=3158387 RepID=UPI00295E6CD6|nr:polysaccharide deacetylase family protein [Paenibacillus cellulosilyticus]